MNRNRLLERFLRYVKIGTAANPNSSTYPSSPGQLELGRLLAKELKDMGASNVEHAPHGLVWATIPSIKHDAPAVLLNAHLDTSPEAPGDNCQPMVIDAYDGGVIHLKNGIAIDPFETKELPSLVGHTLITTDGSTLLGGDDKAGVAVIMELAQSLLETGDRTCATLRILFTCDEEIGAGTKHFDIAKAGARVGYTLDGGGAGTIDEETFSADMAIVRIQGRNTHPSVGKGKMINSLRGAAEYISRLPRTTLSPESTDGRDGFLHPYHLSSTVDSSEIHLILRDFETHRLQEYAEQLRTVAKEVEGLFPGMSIHVQTKEQYRNMGDSLKRFPLAVELAERAFELLSLPCKRDIIRGGTDGALMSALGLPTPNLSVGQYNIHSVREFASLDQMIQAGEHAAKLLELWADQTH